jgi:membrane protease YdiL (CAAX protease family)
VSSIPPPFAYPHPGPPPELPELPEGATALPRWPPWSAPVALLAGFAAALIGAIAIGAVAAATGASLKHLPAWADIAATVIQDLALIGSAVLFARMSTRPRPRDFGLRATRLWPAVGLVLGAWASFFATNVVLIAATGARNRDARDVIEQLGGHRSVAALVAICVVVTVVAPLAEEVFFRGYFFTALRNWRGVWPAAAITGVTFGAIHVFNYLDRFDTFAAVALVGLAVFGFMLCIVYWRTGSLYPCFVAHALNNSLAFGVSEHWRWWQVLLLMAGANMAIAAIVLPVAGALRRRVPQPA